MLCSRCALTIDGTGYTISVVYHTGGAQGMNLCFDCALALLGHEVLERVGLYLFRTPLIRTASGATD